MLQEIISNIVKVKGAAISMQGGRLENQDDWGFSDTPLGFLLIVCDGMGGGPGGKTASFIVKNVVISVLQGCSPQASPVDAMKRAISQANEALYQKMHDDQGLIGMGSTLVTVLLSKESAIVAHLGDSRCYKIGRKGRIRFRTQDHSLVGELVRNKTLTEEQARVSPQSNVIMRALGSTDNHAPDITELSYRKGDRFFLCTDGIWGVMRHDELEKRLCSLQDLSSLVANLSAEVEQMGINNGQNHDNHTLMAVEMMEDSLSKKNSGKKKLFTSIFVLVFVLSLLFNLIMLFSSAKPVTNADLQHQVEKLTQRNHELESRFELFQDVKNGGTKDLLTQIELLEYDKQLLVNRQNELIAKIDSLERVIDRNNQVPKANGTNVKKEITTQASPPSVQQLIEQIIGLFGKMENLNGDDWKKLSMKNHKCRSDIVSCLQMLNKKTNDKYKPTIEAICRELQSKNTLTGKIGKNPNSKTKEEYVATRAAKNKIRELRNKVLKIKNQL